MPATVSLTAIMLLAVGTWTLLVLVGVVVLTVAARRGWAGAARETHGGAQPDPEPVAGGEDHGPSLAAARLALLVGRELALEEDRVQRAALAAAWFARDARWSPVAVRAHAAPDLMERDLARLSASVASRRHTARLVPLAAPACERVSAPPR